MYILNIHKDNARGVGLTNDQLVTVYLSKVWSEEKARWEVSSGKWSRIFCFSSLSRGGKWSSPYWELARIMRLSNLIFTKLPPTTTRSSPACRQLPNPPPDGSSCSQIWLSIQPQPVSVPADLRIWKFPIQSWNCMDFLKLHAFLMQHPLASGFGVISNVDPTQSGRNRILSTDKNELARVIATSLLSRPVQLNLDLIRYLSSLRIWSWFGDICCRVEQQGKTEFYQSYLLLTPI